MFQRIPLSVIRSSSIIHWMLFVHLNSRISLATLFYSYYYQWPLPQSFFYAVDAGMSIGFCTDVAETKVASRAFTVVHILLGASCVGGALVLMVQSVLEGVASRSAAEYKVILERDSMRKAFFGTGSGGDGMSNTQLLPNVRQFKTNPMTKEKRRGGGGILSYDDFRYALTKNGLATLTDREFQRVCKFYDPDREGCIRYDYFAENFRGMHRIQRVSRNSIHGYYNGKTIPIRILARMYDVLSSRRHRIYLIFISWIGMGIIWGILDQGWDPITATHFAVSALATGGLTAPPVDPATGILPTGAALFCGFYCLFGIPLMALTLGIFARVLVEGYIVEEELANMARPLSPSEFLFARQSLRSHNHAGFYYFDDSNSDENGVMIQLSDYIVLQLMRQGKLSLESFQVMKRQYQMLDQEVENDFWWKKRRNAESDA